jgi:hypothetical protein
VEITAQNDQYSAQSLMPYLALALLFCVRYCPRHTFDTIVSFCGRQLVCKSSVRRVPGSIRTVVTCLENRTNNIISQFNGNISLETGDRINSRIVIYTEYVSDIG